MTGLIGYRDQVAPPPQKGRGPLRDIRKFIAQSQTKQMDPNEFPAYEYRRYPLMPHTKEGKPFFDSVGRAIVLRGPDDEDAFYAEHPELERIRDPEDMRDELQRLRDENARLKAKADIADDPKGNPKSNEPAKNDDPPAKNAAAPDTKPAKGGVAGLARSEPPKPKPGSKLD